MFYFGGIKKIGVIAKGCEEGSIGGTQEIFQGSETVVYAAVLVDICHTFIKIHRMYNRKYEL